MDHSNNNSSSEQCGIICAYTLCPQCQTHCTSAQQHCMQGRLPNPCRSNMASCRVHTYETDYTELAIQYLNNVCANSVRLCIAIVLLYVVHYELDRTNTSGIF